MDTIIRMLRQLCPPAFFYLVISLVIFLFIAFQNLGKATDMYCVGAYSCKVENSPLLFIAKFIYILFWTWILNLICKAGYGTLAWVLVLFPIILMLSLIALILFATFSESEEVQLNNHLLFDKKLI